MYVCTNYKQLQKSRFLALFQHWSVGRSIKAGRSTWGHCIPCLQYSELQRRLVNGRFHRVVATIMIRSRAAAGARRFRNPMSRQSAEISQTDAGGKFSPPLLPIMSNRQSQHTTIDLTHTQPHYHTQIQSTTHSRLIAAGTRPKCVQG